MRVAKKRNNKSQRTRQFYTHLLKQFNEFSTTTPKQLIEDYRKIDNVFGRDNYLRQICDLADNCVDELETKGYSNKNYWCENIKCKYHGAVAYDELLKKWIFLHQ